MSEIMTGGEINLFDYAARVMLVHGALQYPRVPGHKKEGTSQIAAESVEKEAKTLREAWETGDTLSASKRRS